MAYPGVRLFVGRVELKRLKQSIMPSMNECAHNLGISKNEFWFNGQDSCYRFKNGSQIDLLDLKKNPSDPMYERYGSLLYTSGWIEEAGEVPFDAYDVLKSRINRWKNEEYGLFGKIYITCNPKKNWLYTLYYKRHREGTLPDDSVFIQALYSDNSYTAKAYEKSLSSIVDPVRKARLMRGDWEYEDDESALLTFDQINSIFDNYYPDDNEYFITGDVARFGKDLSVIMIWKGLNIEHIYTISSNTTKEYRLKLDFLMRKYRIPKQNVCIDSDGVGGGIVDEMPGVVGFVNGSKPIVTQEIEMNKKEDNLTEFYANLKTQCTFKMAELILKGRIGSSKNISQKYKEMIVTELEQWKRRDVIDDEKKIALMKKEDVKEVIGRSPDLSDCIHMRGYWEVKRSDRLVFTFA